MYFFSQSLLINVIANKIDFYEDLLIIIIFLLLTIT